MLLSSTLFVVDQRQFGVVYALGQIKEVITEPGLKFKLPPPFQNVGYIDKRLLTLDSPGTEPMLTAEKQRVVIDWYVAGASPTRASTSATWRPGRAAGANQLNPGWCATPSRKRSTKRTVRGLLSVRARTA